MFSNTNNVVFATGNGTTGEYNFSYQIQKSNDVIVKVRNINDGTITGLSETVDYLVTRNGINGGKINLVDAGQDWLDDDGFLTSDYEMMIKRAPLINQTSDFRNAGPYFAELHEDRFDRQTYFDQELKEALDRAAQFDEFIRYNFPGVYPRLPRPMAGMFLRWSIEEDGTLENAETTVNLSNYYTKAEIDNFFDQAEIDWEAYADQVGVDALDAANIYTDNQLSSKVDIGGINAGPNASMSGGGTSSNPYVLDVPKLDEKKNREGLNFLENGSFEVDDLDDGWQSLAGSISYAPTSFLTNNNQRALNFDADTSDTLYTSIGLPSTLVGKSFVFSGWIGPRSEVVQIDVISGLAAATKSIAPSTEWEFFKLDMSLDGSGSIDLEFRNYNAVEYQLDELKLEPKTESELFPNINIYLEGTETDMANQATALESAYPDQFESLSLFVPNLGLDQVGKAKGTYLNTTSGTVYNYEWNGSEFIFQEEKRQVENPDSGAVTSNIIDGLYKTSYREFNVNTDVMPINMINGATHICAIKNVSSTAISITFPVGYLIRPDIPLAVNEGTTNVYTLVTIQGTTYVACVDGMQ